MLFLKHNQTQILKKMKKTILAIVLLMSVSIGYSQQAKIVTSDKAGWHKLGETTVDFKKDRDVIAVLGNDHFKAIQFRVKDAAINIMDLEVYYESGDKQDVVVRSEIAAGGESRVIDLNGGTRAIKKIVFVYKTLSNKADERANVAVYGMK